MRLTSASQRRRHADERGAAVVEFALVVPLLMLLVCGILDYGRWFKASMDVQAGLQEAARSAVVQDFDAAGCTGTAADKLVCKTRAELQPSAGPAYVRVVVPATGWKRGEPLVVCGMVSMSSFTGLVPLPSKTVRSAVRMSIESTTAPVLSAGAYGDAAPAGSSWTWCT